MIWYDTFYTWNLLDKHSKHFVNVTDHGVRTNPFPVKYSSVIIATRTYHFIIEKPYFSGPQGSLTVCLFTFENGVPLMRWGRKWCAIFYYHRWTALIKPRLLFSHSGLVSWGLPFLQFNTPYFPLGHFASRFFIHPGNSPPLYMCPVCNRYNQRQYIDIHKNRWLNNFIPRQCNVPNKTLRQLRDRTNLWCLSDIYTMVTI